jgi:hypothetical protein
MYFQSSLPIGLIQINTAGEILYFQPEIRMGVNSRPYPLVGQNVFSMLLELDPTRAAEGKLKHFIHSRESLMSVDCLFRFFGGLAPVKMVAARIPPHPEGSATEVVIINFRMNQAVDGASPERLDTRSMVAGASENETGPLSADLDGGPPDLPTST